MAMILEIPGDLEALLQKRMASGGFTDAVDAVRHALEVQDEQETWTAGDGLALEAQLEEGFRQAERGDLMAAADVKAEMQLVKAEWRKVRP